MKVIQQANCNNSPKNQKTADITRAVLEADKNTVNALYDSGFDALTLPDITDIAEITIVSAISHGKSASSLSTYMLNETEHYVGMFFEFTTHKAEAFKEIIVTEG